MKNLEITKLVDSKRGKYYLVKANIKGKDICYSSYEEGATDCPSILSKQDICVLFGYFNEMDKNELQKIQNVDPDTVFPGDTVLLNGTAYTLGKNDVVRSPFMPTTIRGEYFGNKQVTVALFPKWYKKEIVRWGRS